MSALSTAHAIISSSPVALQSHDIYSGKLRHEAQLLYCKLHQSGDVPVLHLPRQIERVKHLPGGGARVSPLDAVTFDRTPSPRGSVAGPQHGRNGPASPTNGLATTEQAASCTRKKSQSFFCSLSDIVLPV